MEGDFGERGGMSSSVKPLGLLWEAKVVMIKWHDKREIKSINDNEAMIRVMII